MTAASPILICHRESLIINAGWHKRTGLHGEPMWYHPASSQFSRRMPVVVKRIVSMLPREWVEGCSAECLHMLRQNCKKKTTTIPRELCCCLLANMFLCTFPQADPSKHALPLRTFQQLFGSRLPHDVARLRSFIHYFERSLERELNGRVPPPVDVVKMFNEMVEFRMVTSDEVDRMNDDIANGRVDADE